jgi:hypothetical protein
MVWLMVLLAGTGTEASVLNCHKILRNAGVQDTTHRAGCGGAAVWIRTAYTSGCGGSFAETQVITAYG